MRMREALGGSWSQIWSWIWGALQVLLLIAALAVVSLGVYGLYQARVHRHL